MNEKIKGRRMRGRKGGGSLKMRRKGEGREREREGGKKRTKERPFARQIHVHNAAPPPPF